MKKLHLGRWVPLALVVAGIAAVANAASPATVDLVSAGNFAVLAGSTITNTGSTVITGNLGLSPGSSVTGFPPGTLTGTQHVADSTAATAKTDLTSAYNDAAGRTLAPVTIAGNIGGQTLAPGLYKSTSSLAISSGDLTLDGGGDANAIYIFQIASTLTTTSGRKVILAGGTQAGNVYWQVGSSATLGTNSVFVGTIMADQSITLTTGATLTGRVLARIGAVTLDSNTISTPTVVSAPVTNTNTAVANTNTNVNTAVVNSNTTVANDNTTVKLPNTGMGPNNSSTIWYLIVPVGVIAGLILLNVRRRKQKI